jgi:hypothetical protein
MADSVSIFSGLAAAAAGLAGDKVAKDGSVAGLDIGSIVTSLAGGSKTSSSGGLLSGLASLASKTGLLSGSNLTKIAGTLLTFNGTAGKETTGVAGLASAILGGTGSASSLTKIASLASTVAGTAKSESGLTKIAGQLGSALSDSGLSLNLPGASALKTLSSALPADTKTTMFTSILKKLV